MKHRITQGCLWLAMILLTAPALSGETAYAPIPVDAFNDGVNHYRNGNDVRDYPRYAEDQIVQIADNILLHQRENGGWASNWDPLRILSEEEKATVAADQSKKDTTFDNRATYPQIEYLAHAFLQTQAPLYRDAVLRGLAFMLAAQYENGGIPFSYPDTDNYRPHITMMDEVMPGALTTLRKAALGETPFTFLDATESAFYWGQLNCNRGCAAVCPKNRIRARIADAVQRGEACLLRLQVVVDGAPTVWAGQYDHNTEQPTSARSFELPSLVSVESVSVVRYLMGIASPSDDVIRAVEHAVAWFERSKITGIRVETVNIDPIRYTHHTATTDRRVVEDPAAPPIWARFYEIDTNRPFMANRDGVKVYSLAEVEHERRTGYSWYSYAPASLLEKDYPAWRTRLGR